MAGKTPLLVVCGPTAGGKTGLALALAKELEGEVVSADSMQIYRGLDIGTAKPNIAEMEGVPHHLLDIRGPGEEFSVAQYAELARTAIREISARRKLAILAGGTSLYLDSVTKNIQYAELPALPGVREELLALAREQGPEAVWSILRECDPALAEKLHPNNLGRVVRAIEVWRASGVPQSEWQRRSLAEPVPWRLCILGLEWPRETLYERIDRRVGLMVRQGLIEEARALYDAGPHGTAGQAIGYKELFRHFEGSKTLDQALEDICRESRRYAKRQMTWLRRDERIHWLQAAQGKAAVLAQALTVARQELYGE